MMENQCAKSLDTKEWFRRAVPNPTTENARVQLACVIEEMGEFLDAVGQKSAGLVVHSLSRAIMSGENNPFEKGINHIEMRDAAQDIRVTLIGLYHMLGLDWDADKEEVNASNWSKFVDGQPIFNEYGKIAKGPSYRKPNIK